MTATAERVSATEAKARARLALAMMTVALSACGGGGGGAAPAPGPVPAPPPVPVTLTVHADAASVNAGDRGVALHATLTGATDAVTWTLSGPGALSASSGSDITYTPPDAESLDDAATATVTVAAGSAATKQIDIAVAAMDVPGHHWTVVRPGINAWADIAYANGTFVALGDERISHSVDGLSWEDEASYPPADAVTWGEAGWVAVVSSGDLFTSPDGAAWTHAWAAIPSGNTGIVFGNHAYLAFGGPSATVSTDGVHWTAVGEQLMQVAFGNGEFLALRQNPGSAFYDAHPAASADGLHWHAVTDPGGLTNLAFSNGSFVAEGGLLYQSTFDGSTWTSVAIPTDLHGGRLRPAGDALFELDESDMGVLLPGAGWQRAGTGDFLSEPRAVAMNADRFVGVSGNGWITTSTDGLHWSTQVEGSYGELRAIDFIDGQFVALSALGRALRSVDGTAWAKSVMLPGAGEPIFSTRAMAHGGGTVVAVGAVGNTAGTGLPTGLWLRSPDGGTTWRQAATASPAESLPGVVYDGHRFVAIGSSGGVYASPDGDAWSRIGTVAVPTVVRGIAFGGGTYLVYGAGGVIATSIDGANWTAGDPSVLGGTATITTTADAALWDGARFVIAGSWYDTAARLVIGDFAAVGIDGRHWTVQAAQALNGAAALARCDSEYVAVGNGVLASSIDGLNWHAHAFPAQAQQLGAVACGSGRFVGVGQASAIVTSTR